MNCIKLLFLFLLLETIQTSYAQDAKYEMSDPIAFKQTGWNKVLCMKNGYTLLFHFEPTKPVVINVFDSLHKNVATQKYLCNIMDINILRTSEFKGLFEINGEAVLFIEQEHLSRVGLVQLRFDGKNGNLIEEKRVGESPSVAKTTKFYVMKNAEEDNYAILFSTDVPQLFECETHVTYYNNKHEVIKEVPVEVDRKKYDYLAVVCAESRPNGICIALDLKKMETNGTRSGVSPQRAIYDHHVSINFIPRGTSAVNRQIVDLSDDVSPYYSEFTYNLFAKTINLLLFSYRPLYYKFGLDVRRGIALGNLFFKIEEDNSGIKLNWVKNDQASAYLQKKTDTSKVFYGMPIAMFTNQNGLTTLVSENYERYDEPETRARYNWDTYFGNIAITQLDDDGNELWGTMLPLSEYFKSYRHYYHPKEIAKKNQSHNMFDDLPEQVTERQFVSLNSYFSNNNLYIIFNDDNRNYMNTKDVERDTIFTLENTNAFYCKMDSKKEITKNYLFGKPGKNEYKCGFIEGADFDEQRRIYATLVQYKKDDDISLRMAWSHLD